MRFAILFLLALPAVSWAQKPLTKDAAIDIVKAHIKENTNDAAKLEIVAVGGADLKDCKIWVGPVNDDREVKDMFPDYFRAPKHAGFAVIVKYREANALGAKVLRERGFLVDRSGTITRTLPVDCIKTKDAGAGGGQQPKDGGDDLQDPLLDQLLKQFNPKKKL
jgi:hypothetical protein